MRSLIKVHSRLEKFIGPLPTLDINILVKLGGNWFFGLLGIGPIYLPLIWFVGPSEGAYAE